MLHGISEFRSLFVLYLLFVCGLMRTSLALAIASISSGFAKRVLYPLKAPAALGTMWRTQRSARRGERIEDSWHSVHRIRKCIRRIKRLVSAGGVVFFHSRHRRLRLVVHPFCFCSRPRS